MSSSINDSGFLRVTAARQSTFIRPPWSLPEAVFLALCSGCGGCRDECPRGLLQKGVDGFPVIDFAQGACDFCGECVDACARGALTRRYRGVSWEPWRLKAHIFGNCLGDQGVACRQCLEHCDMRAIQFVSCDGRRRPSFDLQACSGCGACLTHCPVEAIGLCDAGAE